MKNYQKWLAMLIFIAGLVMMSISHVQQGKRIEALTRDFDTINTGTGPNTGTGMTLLQQAQLLNDMIIFMNTIGLDDLSAQDVLNLRHLIDSLNIHVDVNDTTVMLTPYIARGDTALMLGHYAREYQPTIYGLTNDGVLTLSNNFQSIYFDEGGYIKLNNDRNITITGGLDVGETGWGLDSMNLFGGYIALYDGADTSATYVPVDMRDDAAILFPTIQSAAGDTSNYTIPDKIGDIYLDTSAGKVYVSVAAVRGGWRILN